MVRWGSHDDQRPVVLAFDHPPTDAELQVYQPRRYPSNAVRLRKEPDVWTISTARHFWVITLFWLFFQSGVVAMVVTEWPDSGILTMAAFMTLFNTAICGVGWIVDRQIARQGPLVTYRRDRNELLIEGRAEPLPTQNVTEIVELTLPEGLPTIGKKQRYESLYLVVHQRDGVYVAERLYHGQPSGKATWDAAPQLAKGLGVRYRRIELEHRDPVLSNFQNTKPPKKLDVTKRK